MVKLGLMMVLTLGVGFSSSTAWADQCAALTETQAQMALRLLRVGDNVVRYCEPCGDPVAGAPFAVQTVEVKEKWGYPSVHINGASVDLAYIYAAQPDGTYENLAALAGCPSSSPRKLARQGSTSGGSTAKQPEEHGAIATMVLKARRSEGASNVDAIRTAQKAYFAEHGVFLSTQACPSSPAGKNPRPFDLSCLSEWARLGWVPDGDVRCTYATLADGDDFRVVAECDLDEDGVPAIWLADRAGKARLMTKDNVY